MIKEGKIDQYGTLYYNRKGNFDCVECCRDKNRLCSTKCAKLGEIEPVYRLSQLPIYYQLNICGTVMNLKNFVDERVDNEKS